MIVLNVFQLLARLPGHGGSFKSHKNAFLNDPKSQKEVFGHFLEFGRSDMLHTAYFDCTKWSLQLGYNIAHAGSFKNQKKAVLNDPKSQNRVFDHFLEFGLLDRLDIAYCDSAKRF